MVRSDRANQHAPKRTAVSRNDSIRSEKSDRKVSFNKAVGVKHIPKGTRGRANSGGRSQNKSPVPQPHPSLDEWGNCSKVQREPVFLDSTQLAEAAEDLLRVVDTIDCGATGNTAYRSLERPSKGNSSYRSLDRPKGRNQTAYQHHNYTNVVFNNNRGGGGGGRGDSYNNSRDNSGSRGEHYHNLSSNSGRNNNSTLTVVGREDSYHNRIQNSGRNNNSSGSREENYYNRAQSSGRNNNSNHNIGSRDENYHNRGQNTSRNNNSGLNSGSRGENYHNLNSGRNNNPTHNIGSRGDSYQNSSENIGRSKKNSNIYHNYNNLATRTLPANKQNNQTNQNNQHLKARNFHQSADPLPNPASPLVHSNRREFKLTNQSPYKSVPDLLTYQHSDFADGYHNREHVSDMSYHQNNHSTKVERMIRRFNQESNQDYQYPTPTSTSLPRGTMEPDSYHNHNQNQPFSYTCSNRVLNMENIRRLSPSPDGSAPAYAHVNRKRNSDDYSHRTWDADHYTQRKRDSNDYSAKIIITDDYDEFSKPKYDDFHRPRYDDHDDDDDAYETYQIPSDHFKNLTEKAVTHTNNMNMSSIGVQTDQSEKTHSRSRPKTRTIPVSRPKTGMRHEPEYRTRNAGLTTKIHNDLTSATLVRQVNHGFGRQDRSPSPPPVQSKYTGVRTSKHVVPLLSDTSDSEFEVKRSPDPLARIRSQVMERERLQEEEEEEELRGRRQRTPASTLDSQTRSYPHQYDPHEMTPLTLDEVDALSLVMENDTGTQALVVANESQATTRTTSRTRHTHTSHQETRVHKREKRDSNARTDTALQTARSSSREATPIRDAPTPTEEPVESKKPGYPTKATTGDVKSKEKKEKKKKKEEVNADTKKKKRRIKIKFFYDPRPEDDGVDPLTRFEEFKGEDHHEEAVQDTQDIKDDLRDDPTPKSDNRGRDDSEQRGLPDGKSQRSLSDKYGDVPEVEGKKKKKFLSIGREGGKKGAKETRPTTSTTPSYASTSLGRPRGRENRPKASHQSGNFSTLQQPIRERPGSRGGGGGRRGSESSTSPPRVVNKVKPLKPRYFGDTDIEEPPPQSTTIRQQQPQLPTSKQLPSGPGDYRSLPSRVHAKNSNSNSKTSPRRLARGRSPGSLASSRNSSESEVDSHASRASHVSTGSNRSVYLHATAVADIPVRRGESHRQTDRQTDKQSDRQTDRQKRKVTRSFSLLAPWKPRHYRERYEVDYERKTPAALPPRPPRRPVQQQPAQQQQPGVGKGSKLSTWLRRKKNKEAKGI